jgi:hypothetical protein
MNWDYRILAYKQGEEILLQIHEVYYNEDGIPNGYTESPVSVGSETIKGITWTLNKMLECRTKPILWAGDKFPTICKVKYKCDICGRNTFDKPSPHRCCGGFRKHKLKWTPYYI